MRKGAAVATMASETKRYSMKDGEVRKQHSLVIFEVLERHRLDF